MRRGRLSLLSCAVAAAASVGLAACGGGSGGTSTAGSDGKVGTLPAGIVARVGTMTVTKPQLDRAVEQAAASQDKDPPAEGTDAWTTTAKSALQSLVAERIYSIEAAKCGAPCKVGQDAIQKQLAKVKRTSFNNSQKQFDQFLKRAKLTIPDASALILAQLQRQKIFANVTRPVRFTSAQALAYYRSHIKNYKNPELREARHILVSTLAEARKIRAEVTDANFAELARKNSIDPGSKAQGGDLGIIVRGGFVPEFQKAVDTLKLHQISQPVKTQFGYHIIEVTKITPAGTVPFSKVESSIVETQLQLRRQAAITKWTTDVYQGWRKKTVYSSKDLLPPPLPAPQTGVTITAPASGTVNVPAATTP